MEAGKLAKKLLERNDELQGTLIMFLVGYIKEALSFLWKGVTFKKFCMEGLEVVGLAMAIITSTLVIQ